MSNLCHIVIKYLGCASLYFTLIVFGHILFWSYPLGKSLKSLSICMCFPSSFCFVKLTCFGFPCSSIDYCNFLPKPFNILLSHWTLPCETLLPHYSVLPVSTLTQANHISSELEYEFREILSDAHLCETFLVNCNR